MKLPVCAMEQEIVESINNNDVTILCGETGSGKSTQVPQFLYEAGYSHSGKPEVDTPRSVGSVGGCKAETEAESGVVQNRQLIGITQPRRVAVTSTAQRVAVEMGCVPAGYAGDAAAGKGKVKGKGKGMGKGEDKDQLVGYQIRFDSSTMSDKTHIKFMTDGILLKEITSDLLLRQYSVILLDEAHERNINTDILLGMLSRAIPARKAQSNAEWRKWRSLPIDQRHLYPPPLNPLKLVIMSATLRVADFQSTYLFPSGLPPIIEVKARQHPVSTHFSKRTELKNYLKESHKKVCQIHRRLPEGGILVFLTGKREIM